MSAPAGLTPRQAQVLSVVRRHIAQTGSSPSYEEIAAATGLKSRARVCDRVHELVARGYLVRGRKGTNRTLALADGPGAYRIVIGETAERELLAAAAALGVTPERAIVRLVERFAGAGA